MMLRRSRPGLAAACGCLLVAACTMNPKLEHPDFTADARLRVAEAADAAGDDNLAVTMYVTAAERAPADTTLQLRAADALARNGKVAQATDLLVERLREHPGQPDLARTLAIIYIMSDQPSLGIAKLDQLLAINPSDGRLLVDKAVGLDLEGRHADAQAIYRQVLTASPGDSITANDLALSLMLQGRLQDARAVLAPFRDGADLPPRVGITIGLLEAASGNVERSRQLLEGRVPADKAALLAQQIRGSATSEKARP